VPYHARFLHSSQPPVHRLVQTWRYREQTVEVPLRELGFERDGTVRVSPQVAARVMGRTGQQGRPRGKVEIQRSLVPGAEGSGTVLVDPGTAAWLKKQSQGGTTNESSGASSGGGGDKSTGVSGYDVRTVRTMDGSWKVFEMQDGEPVGQHKVKTEAEADSLATELWRRGAPTDTAPRDTTQGPRGGGGPGGGGPRRGPDPAASGSGTGDFWRKREMLRALPGPSGRTPAEDPYLLDDAMSPWMNRGSGMEFTEEGDR